MRLLFSFFLFSFFLKAGIYDVDMKPPLQKNDYMGIRILDQKRLSFDKIQGVKFSGLSDLTYDDKTETLYLLSDKGALFAFNAHFSNTIDLLIPISSAQLKNKKGKTLRKWKRDSEGLTLDGNNRLLISFEGEAKIEWFHKNSKKYGCMIRNYQLPKKLQKTKNYRSKNKSLESLAWHKKYGILTATEWPLKKNDKKQHTVYALSGKEWHFKAEPERKSSVVAMEVMDDGNLLVIERSYTGLMNPFIITLKKVYIKNNKFKMCKTKILAKMNNHRGWDIDNFEGLAKVGKNRYVMISDDNDNFFQKTLLIYFEVI